MPTRILRLLTRWVGTLGLTIGLYATSYATPVMLTPTSPTSVSVGDIINFDLTVSDVADLFAFQFSLQFDPAVILGVSVTEGPALGTAGTTFFANGAFDNVGGLLDLTGDTLIGAISGFGGSGVLASITFTAFGAGASTITVGDVLLLNSSFDILSTTVGSAGVEVVGTAVPEPANYSLVLVALAVMAGMRRLSRQTT